MGTWIREKEPLPGEVRDITEEVAIELRLDQ
jgi:hypothetical protein